MYKSAIPEGERREPGAYQKERKPKQDRGVELGAKTAANEDDDFTVVRNKDRKRKIAKQDDSDSSDEASGAFKARGENYAKRDETYTSGGGDVFGSVRKDDEFDGVRGARVERGGNRGGRGGFFKNSNKAKTDAWMDWSTRTHYLILICISNANFMHLLFPI